MQESIASAEKTAQKMDFIPADNIDVIPREGALKELDKGINRKLCLLQAPAGFGKSSLLRCWLYPIEKQKYDVIWHEFEHHNDKTLRADFDDIRSRIENNDSHEYNEISNIPESIVSQDIECITATTPPISTVLILDCCELLNDIDIQEFLIPLIKSSDKNTHIVISSNKPIHSFFSDWLLTGNIHVLEVEQLKLDESSVIQYLTPNCGMHHARKLAKNIDGWPAALQLVNQYFLSPHDKNIDDNTSLIEYCPAVADYVDSHILRTLETKTLDILQELSIICLLPSAQYSHLLGYEINLEPLLKGSSISAFLGTDNNSQLQIHPIIHQQLRQRLAREKPQRFRQLHRRLAQELISQGDSIGALSAAIDSQNNDDAALIIEDMGGLQIGCKQGFGKLSALASLLSEEQLRRSPRLSLIQVLLFLYRGKPQQACQLFQLTKQQTLNFSQCNRTRDIKQLQLDSCIGESLLVAYGHQQARPSLWSNYRELIATMGNDSALLASYHNIYATSLHQQGAFQQALHMLDLAIDHYRHISTDYGELFLHLHRTIIYTTTGLPDIAAINISKAKKFIDDKHRGKKRLHRLCQIAEIELMLECSATMPLQHSLEEKLNKLHYSHAGLDLYCACFQSHIRHSLLHSGVQQAIEDSRNVLKFTSNSAPLGFEKIIETEYITLLTLNGQISKALNAAINSGLIDSELNACDYDNSLWRLRESQLLALVTLGLSQPNNTAPWQRQLTDYIERYLQQCHDNREIRSLLLICPPYLQLLHNAGAQQALNRWRPILQQLQQETGYRFGHDLWQSLFPQFNAVQPTQQSATANTTKGAINATHAELSKREIAVLQGLIAAKPDKIIARELNISLNTVRFHLKNLFRKLGVKKRGEAANLGRELL